MVALPTTRAPRPAAGTGRYVGTLVGESTSRQFRLALAHEAVREQDLIAVDATLHHGPPDEDAPRPRGTTPHGTSGSEAGRERPERVRIWAKVERIERINPLFPAESGHELAATGTDPLDTVLSLSRELVTAVCRVLGAEPLDGKWDGKLRHLRYPPRPASRAYRPAAGDVTRIVLGQLQEQPQRSLDLAELANRPEVDVRVDGHAIVTRHLAILAMTGAGKSWTARRLVEELAGKGYPMVIFDPHGDYTGLAGVPALRHRVRLYYAELPMLGADVDDAIRIISGLSGEEMTPAQQEALAGLFGAAEAVLSEANLESQSAPGGLAQVLFKLTANPNVLKYRLKRDLFALSYMADALGVLSRDRSLTQEQRLLVDLGFEAAQRVDGRLTTTYGALARQLRRAADQLQQMERINRSRAGDAQPLPADRTALVEYGRISVVSLAGYTDIFQATLYTLLARDLFQARVQRKLRYPFLLLLEEAHTFVPGQAQHPAQLRSVTVTKQIAQEGRKFGVGLLLISQRPSRLDETTLSQCNSYIIMRMVNPADQAYVRKVIETLGEDDAAMLPDLGDGEAILSGQLTNFPVLVRIKRPTSTGERDEKDAFEALRATRHERR